VPRWDAIEKLFSPRTKLLALAHASNVTGVVAPVAELSALAHARGVPVLLDAAQSLSHLPIDVRALGVDFVAASSHKAFGPTGVGFLYAQRERLAKLALYQVGGGMSDGAFVPLDPPLRFEAGTPAIEGAIGFGAAVRWLRALGWDAIRAHEQALTARMLDGLAEIPRVRVLGASARESRLAIASFGIDAPEAVARKLADAGICVSAGQHCAHPLHERLGLAGTVRASAHVYNELGEIDALVRAVRELSL
jgi:cysteine desulfurase/selenocysteine lyase